MQHGNELIFLRAQLEWSLASRDTNLFSSKDRVAYALFQTPRPMHKSSSCGFAYLSAATLVNILKLFICAYRQAYIEPSRLRRGNSKAHLARFSSKATLCSELQQSPLAQIFQVETRRNLLVYKLISSAWLKTVSDEKLSYSFVKMKFVLVEIKFEYEKWGTRGENFFCRGE